MESGWFLGGRRRCVKKKRRKKEIYGTGGERYSFSIGAWEGKGLSEERGKG